MRLRLVSIPLAILFGTVCCAVGTTGASAATKKHDVDLLWKPEFQDLIKPNPIILDTFDSFGSPFGREAPVETRTPRSQIGTDERSGRWQVSLATRKTKTPPECFGTFQLDRDVIETTATSQIVRFDGTVRIQGCTKSKKFRNVVPGRLGKLTGESFCTVRNCSGGLRIVGSIRY